MKVKVCGMRDPVNIRDLIKIPPDYIGFIFYNKSERYVGENFDTDILDLIPPAIKKVGVFVNGSLQYVKDRINTFGLDLVQIHGVETPEYCKILFQEGINVIKAFGVNENIDMTSVNMYQPFCSYFLFDTKCEGYGGSGAKFNWKLLRDYDNDKPVILSGGIGPEDADDIKETVNKYDLNIHALDINSRFETEPGMKDMKKVRDFIDRIRKK